MLPKVDLPKALAEVAQKGWIKSLREGDTGVGKTIETFLNIPENNLGEPDCMYKGVEVELKSHRLHSNAMITLFTLEAGTRNLNDVEMMQRYGYLDRNGRRALKVTLPSDQFSAQGLMIKGDSEAKKLKIIDTSNKELWMWTLSDIKIKLHNICMILADAKKENGEEYFKIVKAILATNLKSECFLKLINDGVIKVDLRMHLKESGASRNHGTGFRIRKINDLILCYNKVETLFERSGFPEV